MHIHTTVNFTSTVKINKIDPKAGVLGSVVYIASDAVASGMTSLVELTCKY